MFSWGIMWKRVSTDEMYLKYLYLNRVYQTRVYFCIPSKFTVLNQNLQSDSLKESPIKKFCR